jgi:lysophosphatidate acyltransferase
LQLVLDPIPTTGLTAADVDALTTRTRDAMLRELHVLTAQARGESAPPAPQDPARGVASGVDA